ncbi:MAG: hypothetical protein ACJLS3_02330 [Erythrobacter sp.]
MLTFGIRRALGAAAACTLLAASAAPGLAQDAGPTADGLILTTLQDICVPVIQHGELLAGIAQSIGFAELTGEDRAAMGGPDTAVWWLQSTPEVILVVGRDLGDPGSPCRIAVATDPARANAIHVPVGRWAEAQAPAYQLVDRRVDPRGPDEIWTWERFAGGVGQQLILSRTAHADGSVSSTIMLRLAPRQ